MIRLMAYRLITTLLLTQHVVNPDGKSPSRISRQGASRLTAAASDERLDDKADALSSISTCCIRDSEGRGLSGMNIRCRGDSYYRTAFARQGGPVSLYLHYPFCVRKCKYCDFLSGPSGEEERQRYVDVLCREIRRKSAWLYQMGFSEVDTIFFGGGTPSLMTTRQLDHLLFTIADCFQIDDDAEITLECNPGTADYVKLRDFSRIGVNRLSIGVQSFREEELCLLGRIYTAEEARQCVRDARRAGFMNISLDLMSALPGQTYEQWMENLAAAADLEPEHISAYSLILEEGTPLQAEYEAGALPPLPEEDEDRRMYHDTKSFLLSRGYRRYEISNYARPGYESRHNNGYWTGHPYLGLGLGASSYLIPRAAAESGTHPEVKSAHAVSPMRFASDAAASDDDYDDKASALSSNLSSDAAADRRLAACREIREGDFPTGSANWCGSTNSEMDERPSGLSSNLLILPAKETDAGRRVRFRNADRMDEYVEINSREDGGLPEDAEFLDTRDQMAEFMILGLRRVQGVSRAEFAAEYGRFPEEIYGPVLAKYAGLGLLICQNDRIALTEHGIDVSNTVLADFLPDITQRAGEEE